MSEPTTRRERRSNQIPQVLMIILGTGLSVSIALAGWAHSLLMNHDTRLALLEKTDADHKEALEKLYNAMGESRDVQQEILIELRSMAGIRH